MLFAQNGTPPSEFNFNSSTLQAFYFFYDAFDLDGNNLTDDDWVGAFKGDTCVGARQWDLNECQGGVCDIPVMGNDGAEYSAGYMLTGDIPSFKVYIANEDAYYDAIPSQELPWENFGLLMIDDIQAIIYGCTTSDSENYDPLATIDDGTCDTGIPELFNFAQSTLQAFYFFYDAFDIYGNPLETNDWIGAFNDNICVGSRKWNPTDCQGGICDVPVMGNDGAAWTAGYMQNNQYPTFKIYDASEGTYYAAIPTEQVPWSNFNLPLIDSITATDISTLEIPLHYEYNLVSFYVLPVETDITSVISPIQDNLIGIVGESNSAQYMPDEFGGWVGSISEFDTYSGYWLRMTSHLDTLYVSGFPIEPEKEYLLHDGLNLISFPVPGSVGISDGIDDEIEHLFPYIIGESVATAQINGQWVGSLEVFEGGHGYWVNTNQAMEFQYNLENLSRFSPQRTIIAELDGFDYHQSSSQAFYFMNLDDLQLSHIHAGDWILSYIQDVLVGYRQWNGGYVDVPVMGRDNSDLSAGYAVPGDRPQFKVLTNSGELINVNGTWSEWQNNQVNIVRSISSEDLLTPANIKLGQAYPNPFNPSTHIQFSIPQNEWVTITVYNAQGSIVEELNNGRYHAGTHTIEWNAQFNPSGIYFIHLESAGEQVTSKVIFLK